MDAPDDLAPPRPDPYAAWRLGGFRLYAASWFLMTFARQIETVAVGVYIYDQTKNALDLGWLGLVNALPFIALAIPGGQMADRWDRRLVVGSVLLVTTLISVVLTAACAQQAPVSWILLLLCVASTGQALGSPARSALLPQIIPAEGFSNAVAWSSSVFHIASMVGPAAGGLFLLFLPTRDGVPAALAAVVVCRLLSLAGIALLRVRRVERPRESISLETLVAGIRFVWSQKLILATITLDLFAVLLGGATYLLPIFAEDILHFGPSAVGYLRSAEAAGAIVTVLLLTHLPPIRRAGRTMLWAVAGFGAAIIVFGLSRNFWISFAAIFLAGAFDNISVVVRHTLVQMLTPDAMRGRVSAVNSIFIVASNDLGGVESGITARLFTPVISVVGGGIGTILVVLAAAWKWPQILTIGSLQDIRPAAAVEAEQRVEEEQAERG